MNGELLAVLENLEREKGVSKDTLLEVIKTSLASAARRRYGKSQNLSVEIDKESGAIRTYRELRVVEKVESPAEEITLANARTIDPKAEAGGVIHREVKARDFGRIAAQIAKQVIIQKIRAEEHKIVYNEFKDREGEIATAVVRGYDRGSVRMDLGKTEALLPRREQIRKESYRVGRRFTVYLLEVREGSHGTQIIVSRTHPNLVRKLFQLEVPEVKEGVVEIKSAVRDPGFRSKISVYSSDTSIDPVGACVGIRGARVKNVVRELNSEKVDIVRWNEDMTEYIAGALSPANVEKVKLDEEQKRAEVVVSDKQFSLAVGRRGQNIRLISRLLGWRIEVRKLSQFKKKQEEAVYPIDELEGVTDKIRVSLKEHGFATIGSLRSADEASLLAVPGIGPKTMEKITAAAAKFRMVPPGEKEAEVSSSQKNNAVQDAPQEEKKTAVGKES